MPHVSGAAQEQGEQGEHDGSDEEVLGDLQGPGHLWQAGGHISGLGLLDSGGRGCDGGPGDGHDEDDNNKKLKQFILWE